MKKLTAIVVSATMVMGLAACGTPAPTTPTTPATTTKTGTGKGYGGDVTVTLTMDGDKITKVEAVGAKETEGIGSKAITEMPAKFVEKNSADVDVTAGATVTSRGLIYAVKNALDPAANPWPIPASTGGNGAVTAASVFQGFGMSANARTGPGKDDKETQVWSINEVLADVLFDGDGKIVDIFIDQLEVATPNYDGDGMPHFSGFPGQGGYNNDENHDEKVDGKTADTEDAFKAELALWKTKRERGDAYKVGISTWHEQMDAFQKLFVGKTIAEIEEWAKKYTSDVNGRPLKAESTVEGDKAKYDKLTDAEKAELAEVITSATMSVNDAHGNIISAIKASWENARDINLSVK
jgi:uncharacterized protein with FMN-binding domain